MQLAALALYLKAKAAHKQSVLTESNLACADVAIFRGQHLNKIISEMSLPADFTRELFVKFRDSLDEASMMGSLVRLDKHFQYFQSEPLRQSIDAYVEKKRAKGVDESYFANETGKGLRLLKVLEQRYDIVFTNPPYMSNRNMNPAMSEFMKRNYKKSKGDLYSAFIERCVELLAPQGRLAMIAQQSFMFISSFEDLRELLLRATAVESMAHFGPRAFTEVTGEKVNTTAFVIRREQRLEIEGRQAHGVYFRLVKEPDAEAKRTAFEQALARRRAGECDPRVYVQRQDDFTAISGCPWAYQISSTVRKLFESHESLSETFPTKHGLTSDDNQRFIRMWWEVSRSRVVSKALSRSDALKSNAKWFPLVKSASKQRWVGLSHEVLNYYSNGLELLASREDGTNPGHRHDNPDTFFKPGVAFPLLSSKGMSARAVECGFIYDVSSPFVITDAREMVLGFLNSSLASYLLAVLNPTLNFPPGDVGRLPLAQATSATISRPVRQAVRLMETFLLEDETTLSFTAPPAWPDGVELVTSRHRDLATLEQEIDEEVYRLYEISPGDRQAIEEEFAAAPTSDNETEEEGTEVGEEAAEAEGAASLTVEELAQRWVSYAVGFALGRFARTGLETLINADGLMVVHRDHPDDLAQRAIDILAALHTDTEAGRIVRTVIGDNGDLRDALASYLLGPFFKAHVKRYSKRPVYWLLQSPMQNFSVYLFHERATDQTLALLQGKRYLGGRIFQVKEKLDRQNRKS